ncbi:MAG TPA: gene transfer agent family protein [Allosphingosinicella sp.]
MTGTQKVAAANPARGEAALTVGGETLKLRPSFEALVAAEEELGPLFALVERAAAGGLKVAEIAALFWHCVDGRPEGLSRAAVGRAIAERGLAGVTPVLKILLGQILQGRGAV